MPHSKFNSFSRRHLGISEGELAEMLSTIGDESLDILLEETVPSNIRMNRDLRVPEALNEYEYLHELKKIASKNKVFRSYIGQGYNGTITPSVILRNIFENPGWYTQYTPYQAEISQGRLEALLNFQTMVSDLTGLPIANASLLDEGTAAAEAMSMFEAIRNKKRKKNPATRFFIDKMTYAQTIDIMYTRAKPSNIEIVIGDYRNTTLDDSFIGALIQYPNSRGSIEDYRTWVKHCNEQDILVCVAADILSLALLTPPGEWGADAVLGNTQRLGVPMGYGGPHAAYFATKEDFKRQIPGRIIGVSKDSQNLRALRMALQTREQHIKRERATSNICTAQALLAIMAGMYAVYHGPEGLKNIAEEIHEKTSSLYRRLSDDGLNVISENFFDTLFIKCGKEETAAIKSRAVDAAINFYYVDDLIGISIDETVSELDLKDIINVVTGKTVDIIEPSSKAIPKKLQRESEFLTHQVFSSYHTETKMMRYIKKLENKDLSLVHSMIALGSCTMKLNAATELIPVSWPEFSTIHPFAPIDQAEGYQQIFKELETYLSDITGFTACSLQPNSGAQGEYSGLMTIAAYHEDRGDYQRNVTLIPSSAHGTNPASAVMAGMKVVVVQCDENGNIDVGDLKAKAEENSDHLASLMVTYPSTHGVFEEAIVEICDIIHRNGGLVYMDGANMNAQVGLTSPGNIGADVCHLNLHKTFAIPHGGGGPGMGPICVNDKLAPYLPGHSIVKTGGEKGIKAVSAAPWGSASILLISYGYIRMLGKEGLKKSTEIAILNANYMKAKLEKYFPVLYIGKQGRVAHEMILDLRQFKPLDIVAEDVAKRLIDYGFHAPTLSFPVAGTIMIEPTESEDKEELDRFCEALISIKKEIEEVASGKADAVDNVLKNAPHTIAVLTADEWNHSYTRSQAAYPLEYLYDNKFWPSVGRVDNAYGDRNLVCTCPPIENYADSID